MHQIYLGPRSAVYRARSNADGRAVVLKIAHAEHTTLDESLARLRHEAALLTSIRSDRVIRALEVLPIGDGATLVLDDIGGESLDRHLARGRFSLADALRVAIGVVTALRDVHAAGIIHKDVNPSNIVYNAASGYAQLIDFDVASAWRTERHDFVSPRSLEGTLRYMAPEQTGRMNRVTDSRADLYAFGVTLFELLTGRLPFVETDTLSIVHAHVAVRPPAPDTIDPTIPGPVSAIVAKLLAKAPEDRYQNAAGLLADLGICLEQLEQTGAIDDFALGSGDVATRFELPTRLYGRSHELGVLADAFQRVADGSVEMILVSGHSGVGKTAVVRELFPLITRERGHFLSGKFDQVRGEAPYPALVAAFGELIDQLLTGTEDELARWREQITAAIAPNGQVVIDAIPALYRIIGPQPAVIPLDAAATQSRFQLTLQRFIQVFARRSRPLVLFLDDLQWADPESIQLLKLVAMSEATEALLLIEAFRANEVSADHPVKAAAWELRRHRRVAELAIAPLNIDDVTALVADTLHRGAAVVEPLARLVCRKTAGNPFFLRQLLFALHDAGHIVFDPEQRWYTFDVASIERAPISENVADLLADSLRKLPPSTQRILATAAAIGSRFDLDILALIADDSPASIHAELVGALRDELVVPLSDLEYDATPGNAGLVFRRLRFQHDRVQRAAYGLMSPDEQQRMHLRIGRLLLAGGAPDEVGERLFDVVSHLNRAVALIDEPDQLTQLARLDVIAARRARASAAHATAIEFLRVATSCFDWHADYREQLEAHIMLAECCYFGGDAKRALAVLDATAARVAGSRERATLEALRATLHVYSNDLQAAVRCTRRAAALLGHELPDGPAALGPAIGATIGAILQRLAGRDIAQLIDLPAMTDPDALALMALYPSVLPAAFQIEPLLGAFLTGQMVLLSLEHGNCPASAQGYAAFPAVLLRSELRHLAYDFGRLGLELNRRLDHRATRASVEFAVALYAAPWYRPIHEAIEHMRTATRAGREVSDHIFAGTAAYFEIMYRMFRGSEPLSEIRRDAESDRRQCQEVREPASTRMLTVLIDRIRVFTGEIASLTDDRKSQVTLMVARDEGNVFMQLGVLHILGDLAYTDGDAATALELAEAARPLEAAVPPVITVVEHRFLHCLAALATCRKHPARRADLEPVIDANQRALEPWVAACPANFETMYLLVEAERAALSSDLAATLTLYDRATASAVRHGLRRLEALAHELHGRFRLERDRADVAQIFLARACAVYTALGMQRKVHALEHAHPGLRGAQLRLTSTTSNTAADVLDVTAIAKATRAISSELELERLLARMLEIIFENAGAEGGALVLDDRSSLIVAASRTAGATQISTASVPLAGAPLPRSLIHYVHRTDAAVVLDDATADPRFAGDDYIRSHAPHSVLCMPVKHKDRLVGMLYLENTLVSGAFTQARLEALTILVSQIAVSLENATLFAAQRLHAEAISRANQELRDEIAVREQAERELARYRDHLEERIAERTQELTLANQRLVEAAAERERIEAELRLAQKLESVGRLAAGVAHEINTPVQFASDQLTFISDAVPSMLDTITRYSAAATALEAGGDIVTALAAMRDPEAAADIDYALAHIPTALTSALDGLGRVAAIVRAMKDFAHPVQDTKTSVDLNRAIESTLTVAAHEYKYVADIRTELAHLPEVRCNGGEINQVILNLVINAAHAIRDVVGDSGARGLIVVRTRQLPGEVEVAVSDTGTGIPEAIRDKVYDPFFTTKDVGRGTGQGLAIARSVVVDKHGGSLRFETQNGVGTTFFLRLPIDDPAG